MEPRHSTTSCTLELGGCLQLSKFSGPFMYDDVTVAATSAESQGGEKTRKRLFLDDVLRGKGKTGLSAKEIQAHVPHGGKRHLAGHHQPAAAADLDPQNPPMDGCWGGVVPPCQPPATNYWSRVRRARSAQLGSTRKSDDYRP